MGLGGRAPISRIGVPLGVSLMPERPSAVREVSPLDQSLGYFACLQSFLTYSFGWTRHDLGLTWWFDQGLPIEDPRFALISETWLHDGTLLDYVAWCAEYGPSSTANPLRRWLTTESGNSVVDDEWQVRLRARRSKSPFAGSKDEFHLGEGIHIGAPSNWSPSGASRPSRPVNGRLVEIDEEARRATFVSEHVHGWYADLAFLGSALPALPALRNWHVDVYVKPIGFMGTYRHSRSTGLWFSGRHALHTIGN